MSNNLNFQLITPDKVIMSDIVDMVMVPGFEGYFGVLPNHMDMISTLRPGLIEIFKDSLEKPIKSFFVEKGFAEIDQEGCVLLVEKVYPFEDLTLEFVQEYLTETMKKINASKDTREKEILDYKLKAINEMQRLCID